MVAMLPVARLLCIAHVASAIHFGTVRTPRCTGSMRSTTLVAAAPQSFQFPDGSSYRGGVENGMQHGEGEWRSAQGDVYVGGFGRGAYAGHGRYADDAGNVYEGGFEAGVFHGVGTYTHADGRTECNRYVNSHEVGEGVRWSANRARAWQLHNGMVESEIDLAAAAAIASTLELHVPSRAAFALSPDGEAIMRSRLAGLTKVDEGGEEHGTSGNEGGEGGDRLAFEAHVQVGACDGVLPYGGALIAQSTHPLVSPEDCERIISECEARAATLGGWSTARHADENYATTDQPVRELAQTVAWLRDSLLPDAVWPFIAHAFGFALRGAQRDDTTFSHRDGGGRDGESEAREALATLRVSDAFVVKYNASAGERRSMPQHRDGAVFSFNVALNGWDEYEGGGTYFRMLDDGGGASAGALRLRKGHVVAHSSALMHGGHPTTSGVRYILVAFCTVAPEYASWASRFYEHVNEHVDPGEAGDFAPRALPRGMLTAGSEYRQARQWSLEGDRA